jgi:tetratricopeptide (TPR) repeat protein
MILFLDNAESILDPQGTDAQEIYTLVGELSRFDNICLGITSRISTVPPKCKRPIIPTLSMESACNIFYGIYNSGGHSDVVSDLVRQLDFHALSITLLATAASHNMWGYDRLAKEWEERRAQVLRTDFNESLAAAIELSLSSPTFHKLSSGARELLGVVAFFPQGIDENNLDWVFRSISNRRDIFDKFCVLSLTSRSSGFITMLAPIRDYLRPRDPKSSTLLCATRDYYFHRLSVFVDPTEPGFKEARWITSEDANVEHLLDVFTSVDPTSESVWAACCRFVQHISWHKPRQTILRQKIEDLPDDHRSKPNCLVQLAQVFNRVGKHTEQKQLLTHALTLEREQGNDFQIAQLLRYLCGANRMLGLHEEGIQQAKEASEIYERFSDEILKADCLIQLGHLFLDRQQLDEAEDAATRAIDLLLGKEKDRVEFFVCQSHRILGDAYYQQGKKGKAIYHFETALGIASSFNWHDELFWIHYVLSALFHNEGDFDDAQVHISQAKPHVVGETHTLGRMMETQAWIWYRQGRLEDARSEVLRATEVYEKFGLSKGIEDCGFLLREIEEAHDGQSASEKPDSNGQFPHHSSASTNPSVLVRRTSSETSKSSPRDVV